MEKEYRLAGSSYLIYTRSQKWKRSTCWSICHWFGNLICCCCEKLCEVDLSLCTIWTSCQINYMQWNAVICALMLGTCRLKYGFMITTLIWVLEFGFVQFDAIWNPLSRTATVKKFQTWDKNLPNCHPYVFFHGRMLLFRTYFRLHASVGNIFNLLPYRPSNSSERMNMVCLVLF